MSRLDDLDRAARVGSLIFLLDSVIITFMVAPIFIGWATSMSSGNNICWLWSLGCIATIPIGIVGLKKVVKASRDDDSSSKGSTSPWKCPKCGRWNSRDANFCPDCGQKYVKVSHTDNQSWICGKCNTLNRANNKFCTNCGNNREELGNKFLDSGDTRDYLKEKGTRCEMCDEYTLESYSVAINDDMGTRYRVVCPNCLKRYNCTILSDNK